MKDGGVELGGGIMLNNYTTLKWIIGWGIVTIMLIGSGTEWGLWIGIATFLLVLGGTIVGISRWCNKKRKLSKLFEVYYEQKPDDKTYSFTTVTSHTQQDVRITLRILSDITCKFINIALVPAGMEPHIDELYDHSLGIQHPDMRWVQRPNNSWAGSIMEHPRRNTGDRIRIGIKFKVNHPFNWHLEVFLSTEEGAKKHLYLPFNVRKGWDDGALRNDANGNIVFPEGGNMAKAEIKSAISKKQFHRLLDKTAHPIKKSEKGKS